MTKQTIWITGASGRLGTELMRRLKGNQDYKIIDTDIDVDITDMNAVNQAIEVYRPSVIINCASISDVNYCEQNMVEAFKVNALGARNLASASRRINAKIIHLSTDDIFDGKQTGKMTEFDIPAPVTVYGRSKLAGENYVRELNPKHLIIRSSWVYGLAKGDYFSYVAAHGKRQEAFEAPVDMISTPTSAATLAKLIETMMNKAEYGIYHASCEGKCSRYEFAKAILTVLGFDSSLALPVGEDKEKTCTVLENLMLKMTDSYEMPDWMEDLRSYADELMKEGK